jgi:hypothetical protein
VIFDNVEARLAGADGARLASVRQVYDAAADALADRFGRVMIGLNNDIPMTDLPEADPSGYLLAASIGYSGYLGDSSRQRLYREGNVSGPRFRGRADGFLVEEGSASVFVATDGSVRLSGEGARELAERALASSTHRTYRVVDESGVATGEEFTTGTVSRHALQLDLDSAPASYDKFSGEVLARTRALTGLAENECESWLRIAGGDPEFAARGYASGIGLDEFVYVSHRMRDLGRLPVFPPAVAGTGTDPSSPEAKLRAGFLKFWSIDPAVAETAFSSPLVTEAISDVLDVLSLPSGETLLADAVTGSLPLLAARSRQERVALLKGMVEVRAQSDKAGRSLHVGQTELLRAAEDCAVKGITPSEMGMLAALAPVSGARSGSALTDATCRERFASLSPDEQTTVRSVFEYGLRDHMHLRPGLDTALAFAEEADPAIRTAALRNNPSSQDPKDTLELLRNFPFTSDSPVEEVRRFVTEFANDPGSYEAQRARTDAIAAVGARYRAVDRYIYDPGPTPPPTTEKVLELMRVDFDDLMEKCSELGLSVSGGEGIMPYSFPSAAIPVLAEMSREDLARVASVVALEHRYGRDLAAAVTSGLTVEHLDAITPPGQEPRRFDPYKLSEALGSGVSPEEIRSYARPGVSYELFHALLVSPRLRDAVRAGEDPELTECMVASTGGGLSEEMLSFVYDLASRDAETRERVLAVFTPPTDDSAPHEDGFDDSWYSSSSSIDLHTMNATLAEIAGVAERLGGFRSSQRTRPRV